MNIIETLTGTVLRFFSERSAKGKNYTDHIQALEHTGAVVQRRFDRAADIPRNRTQAVHIIGIEKWSQRRLRVALGEPFVQDEYNGYAPDPAIGMTELSTAFAQTRAETLELARTLQSQGIPIHQTVKHNDMGEITLGAWFSYVTAHGGRESLIIKAA